MSPIWTTLSDLDFLHRAVVHQRVTKLCARVCSLHNTCAWTVLQVETCKRWQVWDASLSMTAVSYSGSAWSATISQCSFRVKVKVVAWEQTNVYSCLSKKCFGQVLGKITWMASKLWPNSAKKAFELQISLTADVPFKVILVPCGRSIGLWNGTRSAISGACFTHRMRSRTMFTRMWHNKMRSARSVTFRIRPTRSTCNTGKREHQACLEVLLPMQRSH